MWYILYAHIVQNYDTIRMKDVVHVHPQYIAIYFSVVMRQLWCNLQ